MATLQDLTRMDQIPVGMTLDGMAALRNQQARDQIGLDELVRKQAHEAEMDPLRVQQQQLANQQQGFLNQKSSFDLNSMGRKEAMETSLFGPTQEAALKKLLAQAGEDETKIFEKTLYDKLRTVRPGTPEHGALMKALESTRGFVEEKRKSDLALRATHANNATQIRLEQMRIDAGKYQKANTLKVGFEYELSRADNAIKVNAVITKYLAIAQADPDYAGLIPTLNAMLERNKSSYNAEADLRRREGTGGVDLSRMGNIPTVPPQPTTQTPLPQPGASAAPATPAAPAKVERQMSKSGKPMVKGPDGKWYYE